MGERSSRRPEAIGFACSERSALLVGGTCGVSAICPGEALLRFDEADEGILEMESIKRTGNPSMGHIKKECTGA